jgi:hypothetical protein
VLTGNGRAEEVAMSEIGIPVEDKFDVWVYRAGGSSKLVKLTAAQNAKLKAGEPLDDDWYDSPDLAKAKAAAALDAAAARTLGIAAEALEVGAKVTVRKPDQFSVTSETEAKALGARVERNEHPRPSAGTKRK